MPPQQVEQHYSDWCCKQNHLTDGIALFLCLLLVLQQVLRSSGHGAVFLGSLAFCTVCVLTMLWLLDPARYQKWRLPLRSGLWYLVGTCSCLTFDRLESALGSGEQNALRSAILTSKWPHLGTLMVMFPLGTGYLVNTGLPVLLLFHIAALVAAVLIGDVVDAFPLFSGAVNEANTTLHVVSYILLSVHGFTPLGTAASYELPARFWVLLYWLLMQSGVFWFIWVGFMFWEAKARATFVQTFGEVLTASGDSLQSIKLWLLIQLSTAALVLGCILHKSFVASLHNILFNFIVFKVQDDSIHIPG